MRFLNNAEYDLVLRRALADHGIGDDVALALLASRWPMESGALPGEAFGRGLVITPADWSDYVAEYAPDAEPDSVGLVNEAAAEIYLQWCVDTGRATLTPVGELHQDEKALQRNLRRQAATSN